jgi:hypothetical protein
VTIRIHGDRSVITGRSCRQTGTQQPGNELFVVIGVLFAAAAGVTFWIARSVPDGRVPQPRQGPPEPLIAFGTLNLYDRDADTRLLTGRTGAGSPPSHDIGGAAQPSRAQGACLAAGHAERFSLA